MTDEQAEQQAAVLLSADKVDIAEAELLLTECEASAITLNLGSSLDKLREVVDDHNRREAAVYLARRDGPPRR